MTQADPRTRRRLRPLVQAAALGLALSQATHAQIPSECDGHPDLGTLHDNVTIGLRSVSQKEQATEAEILRLLEQKRADSGWTKDRGLQAWGRAMHSEPYRALQKRRTFEFEQIHRLLASAPTDPTLTCATILLARAHLRDYQDVVASQGSLVLESIRGQK